MALRNVVQTGQPILKKVAKPVAEFNENLWELLDDMYSTMRANRGCGLAGPQVNILKRVFVVEVNDMKLEFVNPEILEKSDELIKDVEGCLSVKGVQGYVERPQRVTVKAFDRYGNEFVLTATNWLARAICHEYDHLNGILFTDIMTEPYIEIKKKKKR